MVLVAGTWQRIGESHRLRMALAGAALLALAIGAYWFAAPRLAAVRAAASVIDVREGGDRLVEPDSLAAQFYAEWMAAFAPGEATSAQALSVRPEALAHLRRTIVRSLVSPGEIPWASGKRPLDIRAGWGIPTMSGSRRLSVRVEMEDGAEHDLSVRLRRMDGRWKVVGVSGAVTLLDSALTPARAD